MDVNKKSFEGNNRKNINVKTLGGWLIPVQIFIILNTLYWLKRVQVFYELLGEKDSLMKTQNISNPALYNSFMYYEVFAGIFFTALSFIVVYLFFKRIRYFPLTMIVYLILQVAAEAAPYLIYKPILGQQDVLLPLIIGAIA